MKICSFYLSLSHLYYRVVIMRSDLSHHLNGMEIGRWIMNDSFVKATVSFKRIFGWCKILFEYICKITAKHAMISPTDCNAISKRYFHTHRYKSIFFWGVQITRFKRLSAKVLLNTVSIFLLNIFTVFSAFLLFFNIFTVFFNIFALFFHFYSFFHLLQLSMQVK